MIKKRNFLSQDSLIPGGIILLSFFPVLGIGIQMTLLKLPVALSSIVYLYTSNAFQSIVLLISLVSVANLFLLRKYIASNRECLKSEISRAEKRTQWVRKIVENFDKSDYYVHLHHHSKFDPVVDLLQQLKYNYHCDKEVQENINWIDQGLAELSLLTRSTLGLKNLCEQVLLFLLKQLNYSAGAIYLTQQPQNGIFLELAACYPEEKEQRAIRVEVGQSYVGECFATQQGKEIDTLCEHYSAGFQSNPTHLVVRPFIRYGKVVGVMELLGTRKLASFEKGFLDGVVGNIANTMEIVSKIEKNSAQTNLSLNEVKLANERLLQKEKEYLSAIDRLEWSYSELLRKEWEAERKVEILEEQIKKAGLSSTNSGFVKD